MRLTFFRTFSIVAVFVLLALLGVGCSGGSDSSAAPAKVSADGAPVVAASPGPTVAATPTPYPIDPAEVKAREEAETARQAKIDADFLRIFGVAYSANEGDRPFMEKLVDRKLRELYHEMEGLNRQIEGLKGLPDEFKTFQGLQGRRDKAQEDLDSGITAAQEKGLPSPLSLGEGGYALREGR